ncbi:MAG TPA: sugar phosphate isomerase/epimerase [Candidatus Dormibacteraeota bacterium]|nr:sugar phosphate isomerase/epimerase [Candidatus Dormibacteraeota bacterium]
MVDRWPISAFGDEIAPDLEGQIAVLKRHSVSALELRSAWGVNVVDMDGDMLTRAHRLLRDAGLTVSAVGSPVGKVSIEDEFDSELARLRAAMAAARRLGTKRIRIFSFFIPDGRYADFRDEVLRRMSRFAREAEGGELVLVHENESYIYGDNAERCRDLVESVASPALRIAFDPANFVHVGVRPYDEAWPLLAPHVAHFHVKDAVGVDREGGPPYPARAPDEQLMASVRPAGRGEGQLPDLLEALDRQNYRGFLVIEPHLQFRLHEMDAAQRFAVALAALRKLLAETAVNPH